MTREQVAQPAPAPRVSASPAPLQPEPKQHEDEPSVLDRVFQRYHPPTGDSGNAIRIVPFEKEWPLEGVGKVKVQIRFEANLKREGELKTKAGKTEVGVGEKKAVLEQKLKQGAVQASAKINDSLLALKEKILDGGDVTLAGVPVALKVEAKFLDAELTLEQLKLDAVKITVVGEGDFGSQVPHLADKYKLVGQLRLEIAVNAELVHDLYKLGAATQELKRGAELQQKLKEGKRALADREAKAAKLRATKGGLSSKQLEHLKVLEDEIKDLKGKTGKLQQLRAGAAKGTDAALKVVKEIGGKLGKTKLGSFLARHVAKAVAMAFKKVLPVYNVISTAVDVIEIAEHLLKTTALGNETGDGDAGGKSQAEEKGSGTGTGAGSGAGSGGDGEAPTGEDKGVGTTGGSGGAGLESTKADSPMPDLGTAGLEPAGEVQLTKSAELVMRTLIKRNVYAPSQTLGDEQKAIINAVVPADLDAEELVALAKLMGARSGALTPIPQLVIEAMQQVRPDGKKRPMHRPKPPVPGSRSTGPRPKQQRAEQGTTRAPSYLVIDLEGHVFDHAKIDAHARSVALPEFVEIHGVTLQRLRASVGILLDGGEDRSLVTATFVVTTVVGNTPRTFSDGTSVAEGITTTVSVAVPRGKS
jgi:hypothetical protein